MTPEQQEQWLLCDASPLYFAHNYCQIYDATLGEWLPFHLWPEQATTLKAIAENRLTIILKARQLGLTWLVLAYALWLMLFRPAATVLLFSRRDDEAIHLLERLTGMYGRLPDWLHCRAVLKQNDHVWRLSNLSEARAFPTSAGDSYTASLALVDEADLVPDLGRLMGAVKPTIDGGGRMVLLSRSNKSQPESMFKAIYRAAKTGASPWVPVFLPWHVRPGRNQAWYEEQKADIFSRTGSLDDLHEQYPATDAEALAPRTLDKRIPAPWLLQCYQAREPMAKLPKNAPPIPGLAVYQLPRLGVKYVIGADPAEGNPTSDPSALTVLDASTGEEVASLAGRIQPSTFAAYIDRIGTWYNRAAVMPERNNHGHAVILWLRDNSRLKILRGHDGHPGWHSTTLGKSLLYDKVADSFRNAETLLHSFETYTQLASIEGATLRAPEGQADDRADSYGLALVGRAQALKTGSTRQSSYLNQNQEE